MWSTRYFGQIFFCLFVFLPFFFCWGGLGYILRCDLISYGLILLSLWICVLIVLGRESTFRFGYFSGFFIFVLIVVTIILYCTFRRISLFSFFIFFDSRLIPTLFLILGWGINLSVFRLGFICCFILYWLLFPYWLLLVYNSLWSLCLFLLCRDNSLVGGLILMKFEFCVPIFEKVLKY